ncbi:MAG: Putative methyltransferase associated with DUF414 [uncultured Sulfurovum sp.]|uniref:Methyltransferase associated with DUF414 n=1 Tax=uncultured Sulfurovum sp. TaxID=269237 RepID=A0A6S6SAT4_9BACT|nr:MAG: Putative methyltransferase associated with DUF414 [uncultured Sulfurovum sp.]
MQLCKICQDKTSLIKDLKKELLYYRCTSCAFVFLDDLHIIDKVQEKQQYDLHHNGFENEGYVQMFEDFINLAVDPYLLNIKTVLEFGSGPGPVLSKLLEHRGLEVDIYDLYYAPIEVYASKKYDLITATEVFEHLAEPLEVLALLVKHTNMNGYIILMTKFPPKDDKAFINWWYRRDPTHISFFTPESFEIMAEKLSLKVLKIFNNNIVVFQKC